MKIRVEGEKNQKFPKTQKAKFFLLSETKTKVIE